MIDIKKIEKIEDFENFIASNENVCVKFSAEWCQPCKILGQRIKNIVSEKIGNTLFIEVDVSKNDDCEELAKKYNISNIPCVVYIKNKEVIDRSVGLVQLDDIYNKIKNLIQ